jgi:hypothetical protein
MHRWMKSLLVAGAASLVLAPHASAQDWALVDGTKSPPTVVSGSVKPKVTKLAAGSYLLVFEQPVAYFVASSQTDGPKGDGPHTIVSSVRDATDHARVHVTVFRLAPDSPVGDPVDARISILVRSE